MPKCRGRRPIRIVPHQTARRALFSNAAKTLDGGAAILRDAGKVIVFYAPCNPTCCSTEAANAGSLTGKPQRPSAARARGLARLSELFGAY